MFIPVYHFTHAIGGDVHSPGFYLHLAPGEVFVASGIWHPDAGTVFKIRNAIATQPKKWKAAIGSSDLKAKCNLDGEMLKRPPAGFAADHPDDRGVETQRLYRERIFR